MKFSKLFSLLFCVGLIRSYIDEPGAGGAGSGGSGGSTPPEPQTFSAEYVRELRAENKSWRLKAQEQETAVTAAAEAAKKANEEADGKVSAAQKAANERIIRAELKAEAIKAGLVDMDALKLADLSKVTLKDDGTVDGAEALFADLKKAKPYLFGAANTSTPGSPPKPGDQQGKSVKDMTAAEYQAAKRAAIRGV